MAFPITSVSIVFLTVCLGADQRKHQSSASLAFVRRIHRSPVDSPHKGPETRKMFPFDDVIMRLPNNHRPFHTYLIVWNDIPFTLCTSMIMKTRVRPVAHTVLIGSISYLYIFSSKFRRCVECKVSCKILQNFWQFFKICNFVMFWLVIWCQSLVWVIMGRRGISERRHSNCSSCTQF